MAVRPRTTGSVGDRPHTPPCRAKLTDPTAIRLTDAVPLRMRRMPCSRRSTMCWVTARLGHSRCRVIAFGIQTNKQTHNCTQHSNTQPQAKGTVPLWSRCCPVPSWPFLPSRSRSSLVIHNFPPSATLVIVAWRTSLVMDHELPAGNIHIHCLAVWCSRTRR